MLYRIVRSLPPDLVRWVGALQFQLPFLAPLIGKLGQMSTRGVHPIASGVGKGLLFDNKGGYPGYALGTSEPEEQAVLARCIQPGAVVYNVGANIGFHAVICSRLAGESGKVFAFEPFPASAAQARGNLERNGFLDRAEVVQCAVSDRDGSARFSVSGSSAVCSLTGDAVADRSGIDRGLEIEVKTISIDSYASTSGHDPDVITLDVEGAELAALQGARHVILRKRPVILLELHWLQDGFAELFRQDLAPLGYAALNFDGSAYRFGKSPCREHVLMMASRPVSENNEAPADPSRDNAHG